MSPFSAQTSDQPAPACPSLSSTGEMVCLLVETAPPGCIMGRNSQVGSMLSTREIIKEMKL